MIYCLLWVRRYRSAALLFAFVLGRVSYGEETSALQPYLRAAIYEPYVRAPAFLQKPAIQPGIQEAAVQSSAQTPAVQPAVQELVPPLDLQTPAIQFNVMAAADQPAAQAPVVQPAVQEVATPLDAQRPATRFNLVAAADQPAAQTPAVQPDAETPAIQPNLEPATAPPAAQMPAVQPPAQTVATLPDVQAATRSNDPDHIGPAPENNSQQFLREDAILLKPGQWKLDVGVSYLVDEKSFLAVIQQGNAINLVNSRLDRRLLTADCTLRYGVADRLQLFADLPGGWTNTETASLGSDSFLNGGGLGDTSFGLSYQLRKSSGAGHDPDIIFSAGMTAPTSNSDYLANLLVTPQASLGQGFWAGYWSVLFIHNYDPVIVYYGFGSHHSFASIEDGLAVQAGDQYSYRAGIGFAVSDHVTLSSALLGAYITEPRVNGQLLSGASMEPVYLRFAITLAQRCERICEPFVELGLTEDAANTRFGVVWTF